MNGVRWKRALAGGGLALLMLASAGRTAVVYVDATAAGANSGTSWANAFMDLQDGLRAATLDSEIWVAAGTYHPTNGTSRSISFVMRQDVSLYGGFAGDEDTREGRPMPLLPSILSGDIGAVGVDTDNTYCVVNVTVTGVTVDGFTIAYANAGALGLGGGMRAQAAATIRNCVFRHNKASSGSGVHSESTSRFENCLFHHNHADSRGGAFQTYFQSPALDNCVFQDNTCNGFGGAVAIFHTIATLRNCTFAGNTSLDGTGNSLYASNGGTPILINCILWDTGTHGGGLYLRPPGGANWAGPIELIHCNVRDGFTPPWGLPVGLVTNVINLDPVFVDETERDLRLQGTSPCLDIGHTNAPLMDFLGVERPQGDGPDLGAYEAILVITTTTTSTTTLTSSTSTTSSTTTSPLHFQGGDTYFISVPREPTPPLHSSTVLGAQVPPSSSVWEFVPGDPPTWIMEGRSFFSWPSTIAYRPGIGYRLTPGGSSSVTSLVNFGGTPTTGSAYPVTIATGLNLLGYPLPLDIAFSNTVLYTLAQPGDILRIPIQGNATSHVEFVKPDEGVWDVSDAWIPRYTGYWFINNSGSAFDMLEGPGGGLVTTTTSTSSTSTTTTTQGSTTTTTSTTSADFPSTGLLMWIASDTDDSRGNLSCLLPLAHSGKMGTGKSSRGMPSFRRTCAGITTCPSTLDTCLPLIPHIYSQS